MFPLKPKAERVAVNRELRGCKENDSMSFYVLDDTRFDNNHQAVELS